jgi:hydroxypyruvate isomerase
MPPTRREVLQAGAAATAGMLVPSAMAKPAASGPHFKLKYAPHFGMFQNHAGGDAVDQLKFAADEGFQAWEDNGMMGRSVEDQNRIAKGMTDNGITMGVFVAHVEWEKPIYAEGGKETMDMLRGAAKAAVECAKRVNAKWMTVVPGPYHVGMPMAKQYANVVDCLRVMADVFEPEGLVMVLEPLNQRDHPGMLLRTLNEGYLLCRAVNSPACKILNDLYHQQIAVGNLIPGMDECWDEVAYFQIGDNPGRNEPTTGEVNYLNVFKHIHERGFTGVMGMEHGNSVGGKEGERKLIDAYRASDAF